MLLLDALPFLAAEMIVIENGYTVYIICGWFELCCMCCVAHQFRHSVRTSGVEAINRQTRYVDYNLRFPYSVEYATICEHPCSEFTTEEHNLQLLELELRRDGDWIRHRNWKVYFYSNSSPVQSPFSHWHLFQLTFYFFFSRSISIEFICTWKTLHRYTAPASHRIDVRCRALGILSECARADAIQCTRVRFCVCVHKITPQKWHSRHTL